MTRNPVTDAGMPLDREIAIAYIRHLLAAEAEDTPDQRREFCEQRGYHPKLLIGNPHIDDIAALFSRRSNIERLGNMTLKEYLRYHYYYLHQGYRYGAPGLQQKWLGHDIIKTPQDCWVYQEIIFETRPEVIVELGVMFGGATHFYASMLDLMGSGEVLGIDVSLAKARPPANRRITYLEGGSTSEEILREVAARTRGRRVMVIADSDHEKNHVLAEIRAYAPFVQVGGYFVVEDSLNDVMNFHPVPNEGPQAAARAFLAEDDRFIADRRWAERYIMTLNPDGFLRRVK